MAITHWPWALANNGKKIGLFMGGILSTLFQRWAHCPHSTTCMHYARTMYKLKIVYHSV